jgi:hypothetical protein
MEKYSTTGKSLGIPIHGGSDDMASSAKITPFEHSMITGPGAR